MHGWRGAVLGICGSLRRRSYNAALLDLVDELSCGARVVGVDFAGRLPLSDPDMENDEATWPDAVRKFRACAEEADGVVIAAPGCAHGLAGAIKNALHRLVGSGGLTGRPTLLASASPGQAGVMRAHTPLMPTLRLLGAVLVDCVVVSCAGTRTDASGCFTGLAVVDRVWLAVGEPEGTLAYAHKRAPGVL